MNNSNNNNPNEINIKTIDMNSQNNDIEIYQKLELNNEVKKEDNIINEDLLDKSFDIEVNL